jgi:hypothetical protein
MRLGPGRARSGDDAGLSVIRTAIPAGKAKSLGVKVIDEAELLKSVIGER